MIRLLPIVLCAALGLLPAVSSRFTEPSSDNKDFAQRWFVGDTMEIAWDKGWNWGVGTQPESVDLFITWFDDSLEDPFWKRLQSNISLDTAGTYDWKVDLEESIIASSTQYHLRFLEHTEPAEYSLKSSRLPSRGFNIYPNPSASSSSSIQSSTATTSTATPNSESSATQSTTASPSMGNGANSSGGSSTNVGAIAGGVVGGLAGLALICGIALFFLRRVKQKRKAEANKVSELGDGAYHEDVKGGKPHGFVPVWTWMGARPELDGAATNELEGSTPREWH